jgi:uroporphyrinogen-III synthase
MPQGTRPEGTAAALRQIGISPNVADSNGESANLVDALAAVASAGHAIAKAIRDVASAIRETSK